MSVKAPGRGRYPVLGSKRASVFAVLPPSMTFEEVYVLITHGLAYHHHYAGGVAGG